MKRIAIIFCSTLILVNTVPVITGNFVFANSPSGYTAVSDNEKFTQCFLAYCRSRDTDIVGGGPNVVTTFTYSSIVNAASQLGIDITRLQAELYYKQEANQGIQWFMTATGVSAFNELFAQLITDAGLQVGDSNVDVNLYDGQLYGNSFTYVLNKSRPSTVNRKFENNNYSTMISKGTYYKHDYKYLWNLALSNYYNSTNGSISGFNVDFDMPDGTTKAVNFSGNAKYTNHMNNNDTLEFTTNGQYIYYYNNYVPLGLCAIGVPCIIYFTQSQNYAFGLVTYDYQDNKYDYQAWYLINSFNEQPTPANINFVTINNNFIKNEYQGDTYINNEGDTINNYPSNPDYDPYPDGGGTSTGPHNPSDPNSDNNINIDFPDIDIDLPEIDWNIGDLSDKFPFSIPFDLYDMFSILNVEPQTPEIKGNVNLGIYQWSIEWDLHQFDDTAQLLRNVEFIGFVIGLIFITRNIIKG